MHPDSKGKEAWDTLVFILVLYCAIATPMLAAYEVDEVRTMLSYAISSMMSACRQNGVLEFLVCAVFVIDVPLHFRKVAA